MNILIASFSFPAPNQNVFDGKFVMAEANAYAAAGAEVRVITPYLRGAPQAEQLGKHIFVRRISYFLPRSLQVLKKAGVPLYGRRSFLARIQIPFLCLSYALAILRHARWADIIHAQWTLSALLALPSKWLFKKKIVLTARGTDLRLLPKGVNGFIHRHVDGAIDCFGPQPENLEYKRTYASRYLRLPLLVDYPAPQEMPEDMKSVTKCRRDLLIVLYVGRFDPVKLAMRFPFLQLIHAAGILKGRGVAFRVIYVGDGDPEIKAEMERLRREHRVMEEVVFLGPRMNVLDYMRYCDVGVGGAAFNAVSQEFTISGKPQVLMDIPMNRGTPWRDGRNALFAKPGDPGDLAGCLHWAARNPDQVRAIGMNARHDMKPYIVDAQAGGPLYLDAFRGLGVNAGAWAWAR
jgi:glycosyltransferase involved in cell wall biosynthesis